MNFILENRVKKLIDYHQEEGRKNPKKLTLELGETHSDALQRLCILEGMTKTALIKHLIIRHVEELGDGAVMDDPSQLYELFRRSLAAEA